MSSNKTFDRTSNEYKQYLKNVKLKKIKVLLIQNNIICWNISYMGSPCKL